MAARNPSTCGKSRIWRARSPCSQDQQAARQRRARIHRGILDRWNEVARPLGWAVENEMEGAGPARTSEATNACSVHVDTNGGDAPCAASSPAAVLPGVQAGGQAGEMEGGESRRPSEPLLAVAANVADKWKEEWRAKEDKWKEDVRTLQLKAEELLMPLTARATGGGSSNASVRPHSMHAGLSVSSSSGGGVVEGITGVDDGLAESVSPHADEPHGKTGGQEGGGMRTEGTDTEEARDDPATSPAHGCNAGDSRVAGCHGREPGGELPSAHAGALPPLPPPPSAAPASPPLAWA